MNKDFYVYGKNPVYEILDKSEKRVNKVYIQKGIFLDKRLKKIVDIAHQKKIQLQRIDLQKFKEFFEEGVNLQSVVASVAPVEYIELEDYINNYKKNDYQKIVILDNVSDPHNFGAIIRTAAAANFDAVMVSSWRSCPITATVEKSSSGAINHIPIIKTSSLSASIDYLKKQDYWIIATSADAKDNYYDIDYTDMNFALVMGSEGSGISKTIMNKADFKVKIESHFESLNVSVATAIIMYESIRQIRKKACSLVK